jgi:hypothetical protein
MNSSWKIGGEGKLDLTSAQLHQVDGNVAEIRWS